MCLLCVCATVCNTRYTTRANAMSLSAMARVPSHIWGYMSKKTLLLEMLRENTTLVSAVRSLQRAWRMFAKRK